MLHRLEDDMDEIKVTKNEYNKQTNQSFITLSDKYENKHIVLRIDGKFEGKKIEYEPLEAGIIAQILIKKKE